MLVRIVFVPLLCLFLAPSVALAEEVAGRDPALSVKPGSGASFRDRLAWPAMSVLPRDGGGASGELHDGVAAE